MNHQHGQSMTEFAVGAATLSLLLLGALLLAGYLEVDRRVVMAARDQAWQGALPPDPADADETARAVHLQSLSDSGVLDPSGRLLLVRDDGVAVQRSRRQLGGVAGAAGDILLAPLRVTSGFLGSGFDLSDRGLFHGNVQASVDAIAAMPAPFSELDLQFSTGFGRLVDGWHAGSVRHVVTRAGGLVPTGQLRTLNAIWRPLSVPLGVVEPSLGQLCLGLIEAERIPEDRLGPGRTPPPGGCP
jgi:hypothetical protein